MNKRIIITEGGNEVKPNLTVPSQNSDVRLVAETSEKLAVKRRGFRKMAKDSKCAASTRPVRKIRLNRSIFNTDTTAKPTIHVKTLNEIKNEKETVMDAAKPTPEVATVESVNCVFENRVQHTHASVIGNNVKSESSRPIPARLVLKPNPTLVKPSHTEARSSQKATPTADTRTVVKRDNTTLLLLPTIQLTRIATPNYSHSVSSQNMKSSQVVRRVIDTHIGSDVPRKSPGQAVLTHLSPKRTQTMFASPVHGSRVKKRKFSPIGLTIPRAPQIESLNASPLKKRKMSPIMPPECDHLSTPVIHKMSTPFSPSSVSPESPEPLPLENPPSPALSLGIQSDDEIDSNTNTLLAVGNPRVFVKTERLITEEHSETLQKQKSKPASDRSNVHLRLGPPTTQRKISTFEEKASTSPQYIQDDRLDVISVIADDDELFLENEPGPLKRSLSQDSVFDNASPNNRGDLRSLAKKKHAQQKHSVGDLISSEGASKSYRIPRHNSTEKNVSSRITGPSDNPDKSSTKSTFKTTRYQSSGRRGSDLRNGFVPGKNISYDPPKPTRVVSNVGQNLNGVLIQEKVSCVHRHLNFKNIHDAWCVIKEIEDMSLPVDVRILEEALKVCELTSHKGATPKLAEIVRGVFGMLKSRGDLQPVAYVLASVTLCRCGEFKEGFDYMEEMIQVKAFKELRQEVLIHFVNDMHKCLRVSPKWIAKLLHYIKQFNFSRPAQVLNNCLFSLATCSTELLREIPADLWDKVISTVCTPPNPQGAIQVQNLMDKHRLPISDEATTKLINLYKETKCTKQLLDLLHFKSQPCDLGPIFADESLNFRDVDAHILGVVKSGSLPQQDVLHYFIDKALSLKKFNMIFEVFRKCKSSAVSLPVATLKQMMDALENWEENVTASVEVYSAMRQAKIDVKKEVPRPSKGLCYRFQNTGWCHFGDKCFFSHDVNEGTNHCRQSSEPSGCQDVGEQHVNPQLNYKQKFQVQTDHGNTGVTNTLINVVASKPLLNGHTAPHFSSFQHPPLIAQRFNPVLLNHAPGVRVLQNPGHQQNPVLRLPQNPVRRVPNPVLRHPQARAPRPMGHSLTDRFQGPNPTPRFATQNGLPRAPNLPVFQPLATSSAPNTDKIKLNRSFSWEPANNPRPKLRISPLMPLQDSSPGSDKNNNSKTISELQQRVERAITANDWQEVYLCYVEVKQENENNVQASSLKLFRSAFAKDVATVGSNVSEFVDFIHKEKGSVKSSHSGSGGRDVFDGYDSEFLGSLGVSLMEKCLVIKKYDKGYEILHTLHAHNISYFQHGKNFGVYYGDIPPSAVAIIAVKLCMGMAQEDGLLGALEVLRACNYATPEADISPDNIEYRIKILQQLFTQLFDQGNISEAYEIIQHLNASPSVMVSLYVKVLSHYSSLKDYDQSFDVLSEMHEKGFDLNIPECQSLYEKFVTLCLTNEEDNEALAALNEMESREIQLNGKVWKEILNKELSSSNDILTAKLFQKCISLGYYSETFSTETPWLCQLGCGYSRLEVRLLIVRHLRQLQEHLGDFLMSSIKDFQIALFPRVSESNMNQRFGEGIQNTINRNGLVVVKVLREDLNPPLVISQQSQEQFHSKFVIDATSLFKWFSANHKDDSSSTASNESCMSIMTRMTEFD